jgi:hypothetical protein
MNCTFNSPLTDDQIDAVINRQADEEVLHHLTRCEFCHETVTKIALVERGLTSLFYRLDCPSPQELQEYSFGFLPPERTAQIESHLALCPHCQEELTSGEDWMAHEFDHPFEDAPVSKPKPRPGASYLNYMPGQAAHRYKSTHAIPTEPDRPVLRGETPETFMFSEGDVTVFVELQAVAGGHVLTGQILDIENQDRWADTIIEVWQADTLYATAFLDADYQFSIGLRLSGLFEIRFNASNGQTMIISELVCEI